MTPSRYSAPLRRTATLCTAALLALPVWNTPTGAETLYEALAAAYAGNPGLDAERARQQADEENVRQAISGWLPKVSVDAEHGRKKTERETPLTTSNLDPESYGITLEQPLFSGFKTLHGKRKAQAEAVAGLYQLDDKEQTVLLDAVTAYADVLRDRKIYRLRQSNVSSLQTELKASRARRRAGDLSKTDVAQARARLHEGKADLAQAEANKAASEARYVSVIGRQPGSLAEPDVPEHLLPATFEEAVGLSDAQNPTVEAARFRENAARYEKMQAYGDLMPTVSLELNYNQEFDSLNTIEREEESSVFLRMRMPLYQGGSVRSQIRQSRAREYSRRHEVSDTRRRTRAVLTDAWQQMKAAKLRINAARLQVSAAREALKGVKIEADVGERDFIDVLDAQRELVDAEIALARSQRDLYVSKYSLLAAVGRLRAKALGLSAAVTGAPPGYTHTVMPAVSTTGTVPVAVTPAPLRRKRSLFRGSIDPDTSQ